MESYSEGASGISTSPHHLFTVTVWGLSRYEMRTPRGQSVSHSSDCHLGGQVQAVLTFCAPQTRAQHYKRVNTGSPSWSVLSPNRDNNNLPSPRLSSQKQENNFSTATLVSSAIFSPQPPAPDLFRDRSNLKATLPIRPVLPVTASLLLDWEHEPNVSRGISGGALRETRGRTSNKEKNSMAGPHAHPREVA